MWSVFWNEQHRFELDLTFSLEVDDETEDENEEPTKRGDDDL